MASTNLESKDALVCQKCGGPMRERPASKQPVLENSVFGGSFVAFLTVTHFFHLPQPVVWTWTAVQMGLAVWLMKARKQAKLRVFHCTRCQLPLT